MAIPSSSEDTPLLTNPIASLWEGSIDLVGDVHGELEALQRLLGVLGYSPDGRHPDGRRLVFLGDLVDRGPDSRAVVEFVRGLVLRGLAQCVLGNHEYNLLVGDRKAGNAWFYGEDEPVGEGVDWPIECRLLESEDERRALLEFFSSLPVVLENSQLRVVHANWDAQALELLQNGVHALDSDDPRDRGLQQQRRQLLPALLDYTREPEFRSDIAELEVREQERQPLKLLTSGAEQVIPQRKAFYAGGRWRFVQRARWWESYRGKPVVVGHYWRPVKAPHHKKKLPQVGPESWWGDVYCVDYGIGKRFMERARGEAGDSTLAALRWPEEVVVFENGRSVQTVR
ncbi:MAG: metallophosphoesterase [Polyangiaceae bacterium]|nr:metallophosphoesterase [Polyangiaceae bacterium]